MTARQITHQTSAPTQPDRRPGMNVRERLRTLTRLVLLLGDSFNRHQGLLRASALTYTTMLSLIPVLAIAFAILKGLGVQNALEPFLLRLAGDSRETIDRIIVYVNNTNFKSVGAIGLLALVVTVISLLGNIEMAFNSIWGVRETRTLQRRFSDYLSVVVVGPILILVATSMTTTLQNQWVVQQLIRQTYLGGMVLLVFRLAPYLSIWIALVFLYLYIPNTRVRFSSALVGGVLAGTAWQVAQWAYFHFQVGVAGYNAIYGTLSALPVFLVWVYTSWLIVLLGVEIVCVHQQRRHLDILAPPSGGSVRASAELCSLALLLQVCRHFREQGAPPVAPQLADELSLRHDLVAERLQALADLGYLVPTAGSEPGWLPAREPSTLLVSPLLASLRGENRVDDDSPAALRLAGRIFSREEECRRASLKDLTLRDLLDEGEWRVGLAGSGGDSGEKGGGR